MITDFDSKHNKINRNTATVTLSDGRVVPLSMPDNYKKSRLSSLLGNTTKSASQPASADKNQTDNTSQKYHLQAIAGKLLPFERVSKCMRSIRVGKHSVDVIRYATGGAGFANVHRCSSVWHCPVCASAIGEERRLELMNAIAKFSGQVVLVTYTLSHQKFDKLENVFDTLREARRFFKSGRWFQTIKQEYGWIGSVSSVEVTHGKNGWHPHVHELVFLEKFDTNSHELLENALKQRWMLSVMRCDGYANRENGLDLQVADSDIYDYLAKYGKLPERAFEQNRESWRVDHEVTKSNVKISKKDGRTPFQMLIDYDQKNDLQAGKLFQEYAQAFKGKRQLTWSNGMRDYLGLDDEKTDEQLLDELEIVERGEVVATINLAQWRTILKHNYRGHVLKLARANDIKLLQEFIAQLE